jgi:hypothetical protein
MSLSPRDARRLSRGAHAEFADQMRERGYSDAEIRASALRVQRQRVPAMASEAVLVTVGGRRVSLLNPCPASFHADDIAHGLAHVCRFSGQVRRFYSVAQHSILVASLVPSRLRRHALLHDGSEAYLQDVPSPVKALLPTYALLEARFQAAIEAAFGLAPISEADRAAIKHADLQAVSVEMRDLFDGHFDDARILLPRTPPGLAIGECLAPEAAKAAFLAELATR